MKTLHFSMVVKLFRSLNMNFGARIDPEYLIARAQVYWKRFSGGKQSELFRGHTCGLGAPKSWRLCRDSGNEVTLPLSL